MFKVGFILILFLLARPQFAFAATINLSTSSTHITENDEVIVDATLNINTQDETVYYLRGAFNKIDTKSTCGLTWNNNSWQGGPFDTNENWKQLPIATISNKSWQGQIKTKIDPTSSACTQSGTYRLRIQRFTESGSAIYDDQNEILLTVTLPTPTNTPAPTPTNTPTPKISLTQITPITNPTMTLQESIQYTDNIFKGKNIFGANTAGTNENQGESTSSAGREITFNLIKPDKKIEVPTEEADYRFLPFLFIGGTFIASSCGILIHRRLAK